MDPLFCPILTAVLFEVPALPAFQSPFEIDNRPVQNLPLLLSFRLPFLSSPFFLWERQRDSFFCPLNELRSLFPAYHDLALSKNRVLQTQSLSTASLPDERDPARTHQISDPFLSLSTTGMTRAGTVQQPPASQYPPLPLQDRSDTTGCFE